MEQQNKVLATRQSKAFLFAAGWFVAGAIVLAVGIYTMLAGTFSSSAENAGIEYALIVIGALLVLWGVVMFVIVVRVPKVVAVQSGDKLLFCGKEYSLKEIVRADYRPTYTARLFTEAYGTLTITLLNGQSVKCQYVAAIESAAAKINALIEQAKAEQVS